MIGRWLWWLLTGSALPGRLQRAAGRRNKRDVKVQKKETIGEVKNIRKS